jgi:hypothetical protein
MGKIEQQTWSIPPPLCGGGRLPARSGGSRVGVLLLKFTFNVRPPPGSLREPTSPFQGEV